jgi:FtsZ-interacting cell division protein ZipA
MELSGPLLWLYVLVALVLVALVFVAFWMDRRP